MAMNGIGLAIPQPGRRRSVGLGLADPIERAAEIRDAVSPGGQAEEADPLASLRARIAGDGNENSGVPQFKDDPMGAIGTVLSEVGAALEGKPSVIDGLKQRELQRRQIEVQMASGFLNLIDKAQDIADKMPAGKRKEGFAILNKIGQPIFGEDFDVGEFVGSGKSATDVSTLIPRFKSYSPETQAIIFANVKKRGFEATMKDKSLWDGIEIAEDEHNRGSVFDKWNFAKAEMQKTGVSTENLSFAEFASLNSKAKIFTTSEIASIERNTDWQRAMGLSVLEDATADQKDYQFYVRQEQTAGREPLSFNEWTLQSKKAGASSVTVSAGETGTEAFAKEFGKKNAEQFFDRRDKAMDAAESLNASTEAKTLLESGVITGFGADWIVSAGKALQQAGFKLAEDPIANTEAFVASRAKEVGRIIKLFGAGTGLSDADREYAEKASAGKITLNEESLRRILDINERAARNVIEKFNRDAEKVDPALSPYPLTVNMPQARPSGRTTAVPPKAQREVGKTYQTPRGPMIWRGNGWEAQ